MAAALNALLAEQGQQQIEFVRIRPQVSHGAAAMVRLGFPAADPVRGSWPIRRACSAALRKFWRPWRSTASLGVWSPTSRRA
jgi:tryptophan synthase alpha subunit